MDRGFPVIVARRVTARADYRHRGASVSAKSTERAPALTTVALGLLRGAIDHDRPTQGTPATP
jgi:hypothetical protein